MQLLASMMRIDWANYFFRVVISIQRVETLFFKYIIDIIDIFDVAL